MKPIAPSLVHRVLAPEGSTATSHPALFMLHGRGADEEDLIGLAEHMDARLLIVSVRAPFPFSDSGYTWYDVDTVGTPEPAMFTSSYERLMTFVSNAPRHYPIDPARVFLLGFSMGTVMAYALALTQPRLFRGVVANSGYVPEGTHLTLRWNELLGREFFITHGIHDPVIPIEAARRAKALFEQSDATLTYREYPMGHQIGEQGLADIIQWLGERLTR